MDGETQGFALTLTLIISRAPALIQNLRMPPNTPMPPAATPKNPFICGLLPSDDESRQERAQRKREATEAAAVSNAIDEQIQQDKVAAQRYKSSVKVLLLGQSESGQWVNLLACTFQSLADPCAQESQ